MAACYYLQVNRGVLRDYWRAAGSVQMAVAFLAFTLFQGFSVGANFWLKVWSGDPRLLNASTSNTEALRSGNDFYLGIFGLMGVFQCKVWFALD